MDGLSKTKVFGIGTSSSVENLRGMNLVEKCEQFYINFVLLPMGYVRGEIEEIGM